MTATTLRIKAAPGFRVDGSALQPGALAALSTAEVARLQLPAGNDVCAVGDLFDVARMETGNANAAHSTQLIIEGDACWLDRLGANLTEGRIHATGDTGDYAALQMAGGTLQIDGSAGAFAGCEMRGGQLTVAGDCGNFAAGALPGDMEGMTGGLLAVQGNAGERLGDRMRRGCVLVGGNAGDFAASRLVAGTIGIAGVPGANYAYGMRRGTLLLLREPYRIPPTFAAGGRGYDVFWALFVRMLAAQRDALATAFGSTAAFAPFLALTASALPRRHAGDLAVDGRGELLVASEPGRTAN
jgi:formylmethanofuran dehydrogenase subunit C